MSDSIAAGPQAFVIGGTGMLRELVLSLAHSGACVTVQGRDPERAKRLVGQATSPVRVVSCDWSDSEGMAQLVRESVEKTGRIQLAVVWMHSSYWECTVALAQEIKRQCPECRYFDVQGSAARSELLKSREAELRSIFASRYHRVRLGHVVTAGGNRWLSDGEICSGIRDAIDISDPDAIVGQLGAR